MTTPGSAAPDAPIGDGGTFDWLAKLTSNRRAVFVASGLGAQMIPLVFGSLRPGAPIPG